MRELLLFGCPHCPSKYVTYADRVISRTIRNLLLHIDGGSSIPRGEWGYGYEDQF